MVPARYAQTHHYTNVFAVNPKPHKSHLSPHQKAIKRQKLERVIEWNSDENMFETHLIDSTARPQVSSALT